MFEFGQFLLGPISAQANFYSGQFQLGPMVLWPVLLRPSSTKAIFDIREIVFGQRLVVFVYVCSRGSGWCEAAPHSPW